MTGDARHEEDAELLDALASVIEEIRGRRYAEIADEARGLVRTKADGFINRLADHLRHEESRIFPELRRLHPPCGPEIDGLLAEHAEMRGLAREMSVAIVEGREEEALGVSRTFLAALLAHMEKEDALVEGVIRALPPREAADLKRRLDSAAHGADEGGILRA